MKQSFVKSFLIILSFVSLPDVSTCGTVWFKGKGQALYAPYSSKEERCRIAAVSGLRHAGLPPEVLRLIASNGHKTRDGDGIEMGFFPMNWWKRLQRVFKHNARTKIIHDVIDHYDDAFAAWQNNPGIMTYSRKRVRRYPPRGRTGHKVSIIMDDVDGSGSHEITLDELDGITELRLSKLDDKDIDDLSNLPPNLKGFGISKGCLQNFGFSKLPKALKTLSIPHDEESKLNIRSLPSELKTLEFLWKCNGIAIYLPLPQGLEVIAADPDGLIFHPKPAEIRMKIGEMDTTYDLKWNDGNQIYLICYHIDTMQKIP